MQNEYRKVMHLLYLYFKSHSNHYPTVRMAFAVGMIKLDRGQASVSCKSTQRIIRKVIGKYFKKKVGVDCFGI